MQNIADAFSYQFKDQDWVKKFLLGTLAVISCFFIIPIPLLTGYFLQLQRNVMDKKQNPLPAWANLGEMFIDGLKLMVYMLGYALPWLLFFFFFILIAIISYFIDEDLFGFVIMFFSFAFQGLIMLYGLAMLFINPVLYIKAAKRESWKEFYNFKEIYKFIKNNFTLILLVVLLNWACGMIVNFGMFFLFIGLFPAAFYSGTIIFYLYGQLSLQVQK